MKQKAVWRRRPRRRITDSPADRRRVGGATQCSAFNLLGGGKPPQSGGGSELPHSLTE